MLSTMESDAVACFCPFLELPELRSAARMSRRWQSCVAACVRALPSPWSHGPLEESMVLSSLELCHIISHDDAFDYQEYDLAVLVSAGRLEDVAERACELVATLPGRWGPPNVPRGDSIPRTREAWQRASPAARAVVRPSLADLRRQWSSAYMQHDGSYDMSARRQVFGLLEQLRAVSWSAGLCGSSFAWTQMQVMQQNEVRGKERWTFHAMALEAPFGVLAAVKLSYYDQDKHFVR